MKYKVDTKNLNNTIAFFNRVLEELGEDEVNGREYSFPDFDSIEVDMEDNLCIWADAKRHIYELFGNELKIEIPLDNVNVANHATINNTVKTFLNENEAQFNPVIKYFLSILDPEDFEKNMLTRSVKVLDKTFKEGQRISRCLNDLEIDKQLLDEQQSLYSTLVQKLQMSGTLVFSIDPIDYFTMSVSSSGWSSCHHPSSCYGAGGLAYMNDRSTVIAYIKTEDPITYYVNDPFHEEKIEISFDNKVWRQIINFNSDLSYAVQMKGYPNANDLFTELIAKELQKLLGDYIEEEYTSFNASTYGEELDIQAVNPHLEGHMFYCDYYTSNLEEYTVTYRQSIGDRSEFYNSLREDTPQIIIGEIVYCACGCGYVNYTDRAIMEESCEDYSEGEYY